MTKASAKRRPSKKAVPMRAGRVAIVGRPNAGKSTLLNALVGMRLAIATDKPGTTRSSLLGVATFDDPPTQIAFVDTPGLHRPKSALGSVLVEEAERGLVDVDAVALVVTSPTDTDLAKGKDLSSIPSEADAAALALAASSGKPIVLVVNKIDRLKDKRQLLPVLERWAAVHPFAALVPLSALRGGQLENLVTALREHLPEGKLFEDDFVTDRSERFLVAELVREAAMEQTRQEVPHGLAVSIDRFLEQDGRAHVMATLVVEKESHKGIVLGRGGARIKAIGTTARRAAEALLERPVHLELWVRVEPSWTSDPDRARRRVRDVEGT